MPQHFNLDDLTVQERQEGKDDLAEWWELDELQGLAVQLHAQDWADNRGALKHSSSSLLQQSERAARKLFIETFFSINARQQISDENTCTSGTDIEKASFNNDEQPSSSDLSNAVQVGKRTPSSRTCSTSRT